MIDVAKERTRGALDDEESNEDVMELDSDDEEEEEEGERDSSSGSDADSDDDLEETQDTCLDLFIHDMGQGTGFRPGRFISFPPSSSNHIVLGSFDGCISISALQWLCHSNRSHEIPKARLTRLFNTLFGCLARGARAVFQFYPETSTQIDLILGCAMKVYSPPLLLFIIYTIISGWIYRWSRSGFPTKC